MATDSDIQDLREAAGETIYLVPMSIDGGLRYAWCDDPAPEEGMDASEAVEYVRRDKYDTLAAHVEHAWWDGFNAENSDDINDSQSVTIARSDDHDALARLKAQWQAEILEVAKSKIIEDPHGDPVAKLEYMAYRMCRQAEEPNQ